MTPCSARVPRTGLEPARPCGHQALNLARLPIPPPRRYMRIIRPPEPLSRPRRLIVPGPADPVIDEPVPVHGLRLVQVPPVEDDPPAEEPAHHLEVRVPKLRPLGHDRQSVR